MAAPNYCQYNFVPLTCTRLFAITVTGRKRATHKFKLSKIDTQTAKDILADPELIPYSAEGGSAVIHLVAIPTWSLTKLRHYSNPDQILVSANLERALIILGLPQWRTGGWAFDFGEWAEINALRPRTRSLRYLKVPVSSVMYTNVPSYLYHKVFKSWRVSGSLGYVSVDFFAYARVLLLRILKFRSSRLKAARPSDEVMPFLLSSNQSMLWHHDVLGKTLLFLSTLIIADKVSINSSTRVL